MAKILRVMCIIVMFQSVIYTLQAQSPPRIRTTSNLKDANGDAVIDGIYSITFRLYYEESGGTVLWTELAPVTVKGGIYTHLLGSITPLSTINFNSKLFLGTQIGEYELTPRTELTYAPYAVAAQQVVCSGSIGDVKYSLLNPTQFAMVNGDCWVPMDGREIPNSKLEVSFGIGTAPDGSGLFIRSQEFTNSPTTNDPGRTTSSSIATFQADEVLGHGHTANNGVGHTHLFYDTRQQESVYYTYGGILPCINCGYDIGGQFSFPNVRTTSSSTTGISVGNNTGPETRPKNLNLYAYIRIN